MKTPHKHAELIKKWADGAVIQLMDIEGWVDVEHNEPSWNPLINYRIKPEPKPDVIAYIGVSAERVTAEIGPLNGDHRNNLRLTFDGETGALKAAEVLK